MSIMVGPKFFRVQTELETNLGHISSSGLNRGTDRGLESKSDQSQLNARKPGFADLYGRGAEALDHMPESLLLFNNAALPLLTGPHLPAGLISISMSASCSQYVITILPGFLALSANLKLHRLCFVRIQLVKRSGTKEAASL